MKKKAIAILTTIIISITIFMDTPFAEAHGPNNLISTPYGTCTYEFYYEANNAHNVTIGGITIPQLGPVHVIRYTFTHPYTGTFDLDLNNSSILNNIWNLITSNCYLMSVPEADTLRFAVNNAEYCEIAIMPSQYYNQLFMSLKNQNLTAVEDTTTAVNSILSHVSYIDGQIQQIHADTTMVRNLLISMSGYSADSDDNIATDMDTLISAMNNSNTLLQNIDNDILGLNDIGWNNIVNTYQGFTSDFSTYSTTSGNYADGYFVFDPISFSTLLYGNDPIIKIQFSANAYGLNQENNFKPVILTTNNTERDLSSFIIYSYYSRGGITWYLKLDSRSQSFSTSKFAVKVTGSKYIYMNSYNRVEYLNHNQDDYYLVLNCISNFNHSLNDDDIITAINDVESAVRSMAINVNNLTVNATGITYNVNNTQVNNSVNTYNTDIQNVYNVENDFSTTFNTYNEQFTPDFTETMTTIQNVPSVMNGIVVDLYNLPFIKYPLLLTLAGIVLIALLGV